MRIRLMALLHLISRPMTIGMRCAAFDEAGRLFLVRHTYMPGWYMPGGGMEPGQTAEEALRRELEEEGHLVLTKEPTLLSVHLHREAFGRDHVLFYLARNVRQTHPKAPDFEIAESGFFALDALPEGLTPATLRRLAEALGEAKPDASW